MTNINRFSKFLNLNIMKELHQSLSDSEASAELENGIEKPRFLKNLKKL